PTQTGGRFESPASWISAYPRAAPKRPRAWTLRAPSRKAARSSASAVGLPLGRGAKCEAADGIDSKAHDRLRAKARDGGARFKRTGASDQPPSTPSAPMFLFSQVVESGAAWERAGLAKLGELDASAADDAADFGEPQFLPKGWQFPLRDGQKQRVVFAAAQCQLHAVGKTASRPSQRKRAAFD